MKIDYIGHSAFRIVTQENVEILIDPFISENPATLIDVKSLNPDIEYIEEEYERLLKERPEMMNDTFNKYPKKRGGFLFI